MPSLRQVAGVPDSTASISDSVLIIIDAQDEYKFGPLATKGYDQTNQALSRLLWKYRNNNGKIIHVVHNTGIDQAPIFSPNGKLTKEMDEVQAIEGEPIISKKFAGSFHETNLQSVLRDFGLQKLVLTGYMAHGCVSSTAREAHSLGYDVIVAEDAVGQRDLEGVEAGEIKSVAMAEIHDMFGTVVKSSEIK